MSTYARLSLLVALVSLPAAAVDLPSWGPESISSFPVPWTQADVDNAYWSDWRNRYTISPLGSDEASTSFSVESAKLAYHQISFIFGKTEGASDTLVGVMIRCRPPRHLKDCGTGEVAKFVGFVERLTTGEKEISKQVPIYELPAAGGVTRLAMATHGDSWGNGAFPMVLFTKAPEATLKALRVQSWSDYVKSVRARLQTDVSTAEKEATLAMIKEHTSPNMPGELWVMPSNPTAAELAQEVAAAHGADPTSALKQLVVAGDRAKAVALWAVISRERAAISIANPKALATLEADLVTMQKKAQRQAAESGKVLEALALWAELDVRATSATGKAKAAWQKADAVLLDQLKRAQLAASKDGRLASAVYFEAAALAVSGKPRKKLSWAEIVSSAEPARRAFAQRLMELFPPVAGNDALRAYISPLAKKTLGPATGALLGLEAASTDVHEMVLAGATGATALDVVLDEPFAGQPTEMKATVIHTSKSNQKVPNPDYEEWLDKLANAQQAVRDSGGVPRGVDAISKRREFIELSVAHEGGPVTTTRSETTQSINNQINSRIMKRALEGMRADAEARLATLIANEPRMYVIQRDKKEITFSITNQLWSGVVGGSLSYAGLTLRDSLDLAQWPKRRKHEAVPEIPLPARNVWLTVEQAKAETRAQLLTKLAPKLAHEFSKQLDAQLKGLTEEKPSWAAEDAAFEKMLAALALQRGSAKVIPELSAFEADAVSK